MRYPIESLEGLANVDAIATVEGTDMIAYGHSDLSAKLGIHLQLDHPRFKAVVRQIANACKKHGKLARGSANRDQRAAVVPRGRSGVRDLGTPASAGGTC